MGYTINAYLDTRIALLSSGLTRTDLLIRLVEADYAQYPGILRQLGIPESAAETMDDEEGFEQQLNELMLREVTLLLRATKGPLRGFIIQWLRQHEVMNIKSLLRLRAHGEKSDADDVELVDLGPFSSLSPETLRASEDVNEILRVLDRYGYSSVAQKVRRSYEERQNMFEVEAIIDRQYYNDLVRCFRFLPDDQQKVLRPLLGMLLDRVNLVWLLRYRLNYGMDVSHIYYLLAPPGTWLKKTVLMTMVSQDNLQDIQSRLPRVWQQALTGRESLEEIENAADWVFVNFVQDMFQRKQEPEVRLVSYLWLRQMQLKQIAIINKGRQIGLDKQLVNRAAALNIQTEDKERLISSLIWERAG